MFEAIRRIDCAGLRTLAKAFVGIGNDSAALLCLDHVFSFPLELRKLPPPQVQASLSLYLNYIRLLNKFRRDESSAGRSNRQRVFGFQALGGDRYLVPKNTLLHGKLSNRSDPGGKGADGHRCGYDEIRRGIIQLMSSRIDGRTEIQNDACRDVHGFSPCLRFLVQKKCSPQGTGPCTFQHIQLEQLTIDWYRTRLRLILMQFQILDSARCDNLDVKKYVPDRSAGSARILINRVVTGLGCCIQPFIHLFRGSDPSQISTLTAYLRKMMVSGLYENGLKTSAVTSTPPGLWTASGDGSWLHLHSPSTLIEKKPGISFLGSRCASRHRCGRNTCPVGRGIPLYMTSPRLYPPKRPIY